MPPAGPQRWWPGRRRGVEDRCRVGCPGPGPSQCARRPDMVRIGRVHGVQKRPRHSPVRGLPLVLEKQRDKSSGLVFTQAATELCSQPVFLKESQAAENPA